MCACFSTERTSSRTLDSINEANLIDGAGRLRLIFGLIVPVSLSGISTAGLFSFIACWNEFWWVGPYVAKGLWRGELSYAMYFLNSTLRKQLMRMLGWQFGIRTGFSRSPGKCGKNLEGVLGAGFRKDLEKTYPGPDFDDIWEALFAMGDLFTRTAAGVAEHFGFPYPAEEAAKVTAFLRHIRGLAPDAPAIRC